MRSCQRRWYKAEAAWTADPSEARRVEFAGVGGEPYDPGWRPRPPSARAPYRIRRPDLPAAGFRHPPREPVGPASETEARRLTGELRAAGTAASSAGEAPVPGDGLGEAIDGGRGRTGRRPGRALRNKLAHGELTSSTLTPAMAVAMVRAAFDTAELLFPADTAPAGPATT
ncbi:MULTISPECIES: hypothetical protein [Streptomycetaceae]|uniref:hypothetical protein n=1 Tax=Streptomycetaceae TaxID=2062 RepID=UPI00094036FC|nr:hypothetical protein [Streptomyces sp. CB02056]OKH97576.1 hypothetical protein AMK13_38455 [Streptomyces sp. CB02056]